MRTITGVFAGFLFASSAFALPADPASLLFDTFSAKCESQGKFTATALRETNALMGVFESLLSDPECKNGLQPLLQSVTSLNADLAFLNNGFNDDPKKDLEDYASKVSLFLATTSSEEDRIGLASQLADTQIQILKYDVQRNAQIRASQARAVQNLSAYVEMLGKIYPSQTLCFERNRTLPVQLSGHLMALAGGFFGPAIDAAAVLAGRLFSSIFDYFQDRKFVEAIRKIRGAKLQAGLSCAIEALEQSVCDIQDHKDLIRVHEDYRNRPQVPIEWMGYDLVQRQYSTVQNFLQQIEAGNEPTSDLQGTKRSDFRKMEGSYRALHEKISGLIGETERQNKVLNENNSGTQSVQQQLANLVDKILGNIFESGVYNSVIPSVEGYARMTIWIRTGTPNPDVSALGNTTPYQAYLTKIQDQPLTIDLIRANTKSIHDAAGIQLKVQKTLALNPDIKGALASWTKRTKNLPSPGEIMEDFLSYLERLQQSWVEHPEWFANSYSQRDQVNLAATLSEQFRLTLEALRGDSSDRDKVTQIYTVMQLQEQDQIVLGRLKAVVEMDLEKRLRHSFLSKTENLETSIRLATEELFDALYPGAANLLTKQKQDLSEAEVLSKWNLQNFFDFFRPSIEKALQDLLEQSALWHEDSKGPFREKISKLCLLTLNAPTIDSSDYKKIVRLCRGAEMRETISNRELSIRFDPLFSEYQHDPEKRLCLYRRFRNQIDLQESLQLRLSQRR